ncbi:16801_t:CDS:2 [Dentiscutata heterogama]|uniref:16801_t:CDS:1 n=1 Tax=Dentiscutata heterogama TaxID=1316150 RepID=A0ACA9N5E9_9GLOM|nr:16801_t:CDS:2 [Dentiscutata heterogama]
MSMIPLKTVIPKASKREIKKYKKLFSDVEELDSVLDCSKWAMD